VALRAEALAVDGAKLHYQSTGRGPAVITIGGAGAGVLEFRRLGRRLAREFQVISYDRRGTLQSTGRTDHDLDLAQESRDIVTLLDALGVREAVVFATCGGASVGFDFTTRYPGYVRAHIVHEPLTIGILPDAGEQRAFFADLCQLNERQGIVAAYRAWTKAIGVDSQPVFGPRSMARAKRDGDYVFRHHVMPMVDFMPDLAAIRAAGTPTAVAVGDGSLAGDYRQVRISRAMADELGCALVTFPGHHHAYEDRPDEFARSLAETIRTF
jgi:pimeloyl-ACP methyl ester carboxylesterase